MFEENEHEAVEDVHLVGGEVDLVLISGGIEDKLAHAEPSVFWPFEVTVTLMAANYLILVKNSSRKPDFTSPKSRVVIRGAGEDDDLGAP